MNNTNKRLGDILLDLGKIDPEQLKQGLAYQNEHGVPLGQALEALGIIAQEEIIDALSRQAGIPYVELLEEASENLSKTLDINELLTYILTIAKKGLNAERGTVFVVDKDTGELWSKVFTGGAVNEIRIPLGSGIAGKVAQTGETVNLRDAYADPCFNREIDVRTGYRTNTILAMPIRNPKNEIVGVFQMLNKIKGFFDRKDEGFLKLLANYSSTALEMGALHEELMEKKRIEHELTIARQIQVSLLPESIPQIAGYDVFGWNDSCDTVSGDYFDVFPIDQHQYMIAIGDVSGKGVPASLMMAVLQSHLKAVTMMDIPLPELVAHINEYLVRHSLPDKFITFFLGKVNTKDHSFEYVNAGHDPPWLINRRGKAGQLKLGGPLIGMVPGVEYLHEKFTLDPDDLIFCYTDGVTEHFNDKCEEYGEGRLLKFLQKNYTDPPKTIYENLRTELAEFSKGVKRSDDVTVLMLKRR